MLVQLNKCVVVCGSDLQRCHSGDGRLRRFCLNMKVVDLYVSLGSRVGPSILGCCSWEV